MHYVIEQIGPRYDRQMCQIIRRVGAEYGAIGEGFGPSDAEVAHLSAHYGGTAKSCYLVALIDGEVVGGCGIAAFNSSARVCELRKLFIASQHRGAGIGRALAQRCLSFAVSQGYQQCYLDTLSGMQAAISLYQALGFRRLDAPLDGSLHGGCDVWMLKAL